MDNEEKPQGESADNEEKLLETGEAGNSPDRPDIAYKNAKDLA